MMKKIVTILGAMLLSTQAFAGPTFNIDAISNMYNLGSSGGETYMYIYPTAAVDCNGTMSTEIKVSFGTYYTSANFEIPSRFPNFTMIVNAAQNAWLVEVTTVGSSIFYFNGTDCILNLTHASTPLKFYFQ